MPNGIDYVKAHFAVVENWQGKEIYVIDINLRPAMTGTYNFCICDISTNGNNLHGGGEALAENCLNKCKHVEDGVFEGSVQKRYATIDEDDLQYYKTYTQSYWHIHFSLGKVDEVEMPQLELLRKITKLMFCANELESSKVWLFLIRVKNL